MKRLLLVVSVILPLLAVWIVQADAPATPQFDRTWARTDKPIADGVVSRSWNWAPDAFTGPIQEPYAEAPGGQRAVQYFDKARMEDNTWRTIDVPWDVTTGLLAMEMITGRVQIGDAQHEQHEPSTVPIAGDTNTSAIVPRYGDLDSKTAAASFLNAEPHPEGEVITAEFTWFGGSPGTPRVWGWADDQQYADYGVIATGYVPQTNHRIAEPFWRFMNATGPVYENGQFVEGNLFQNPFFATGYPVTEAYWWRFPVGGEEKDVLMQCFERRCLTYTPSNAPEWQVEMGNIGRHYYAWKTNGSPPAPAPTATVPSAPTATSPDTGGAAFGNGIWLVGTDIQPGIYRNDNSTELCYWARLSGLGGTLDDIIANELSRTRELVEIKQSDYAFESDDCGNWSSDLSPITGSPTAGFGDGKFFVGTEVASGIWRNSDSSDDCYWERLSGFGGTLNEINANSFSDVSQVVEISASDLGFTSRRCGTWTYNPGPVTSSLTADIEGGTYIVALDIQAGIWETDQSPEGCYWERRSGFSGTLDDVIDNEFVSDDEASSLPQRVRVSPSDAGFYTNNDCGTWHFAGP